MNAQIKIPVSIGETSVNYVAIETSAPKAYDGFGTFAIYEYESENPKDSFRIVLVREEHLTWQTARYQSGIHYANNPAYDSTSIQDYLWNRLTGRCE